METMQMVVEIDAEISRLQQVRALLTGDGAAAGNGRRRTKRTLSAEARARIAAAQRRRWAKQKRASK